MSVRLRVCVCLVVCTPLLNVKFSFSHPRSTLLHLNPINTARATPTSKASWLRAPGTSAPAHGGRLLLLPIRPPTPSMTTDDTRRPLPKGPSRTLTLGAAGAEAGTGTRAAHPPTPLSLLVIHKQQEDETMPLPLPPPPQPRTSSHAHHDKVVGTDGVTRRPRPGRWFGLK